MWRTPQQLRSTEAQLEPSVVFVGNRIQSRTSVYVTGIPNHFKSEQIAKIFSRAGNIGKDFRGELRIKMYGFRGFNGRAMITFEKDKEAFLACNLIDKERHCDNILKVAMALIHFNGQRNEPNLENSDWTCNLCDKRGLTRVNYVWQKTCYNCQNDKEFCDSFGKRVVSQKENEEAQVNEPKAKESETAHSVIKHPKNVSVQKDSKPLNNKKEIRLAEQSDFRSNRPLLNPFFHPKVEVKEEIEVVNIRKSEVTFDSGTHSSSGDDSSESSDREDKCQENMSVHGMKVKGLHSNFDKPEDDAQTSSQENESKTSSDKGQNVHNLSSSEDSETSMDTEDDLPDKRVLPLDKEPSSQLVKSENANAEDCSEYFEYHGKWMDNVPDDDYDCDISRLKNQLESENEEALLNTFSKHKVFKQHFPLKIKIDVSKVEKSAGLDRLSYSNEKLNVDLNFDENIAKAVADHKHAAGEQNVALNDITLEDVTDDDDKPQEETTHTNALQPSTKIANGVQDESMDSEESETDDDNFDQPGSVFIPMHSYVQKPIDNHPGEEDKARKKFTLDQDKVILDKIMEILPGQRLDYLELSAASSPCKEVARRIGRTESSIQGRWKYQLRIWLLEYYSKKTKSWTGFTVKASTERRKAVADYFVQELRKRRLKMDDGLTAQPKLAKARK